MKKRVFQAALILLVFTSQLQAQVTLEQAQRYLEMEQYDNARKAFKQLAETNPTAENYYYLGEFYLKDQQPDLAKEAFQKGLQQDEKYQLNKVGLGAVMVAKGDTSQARQQFGEVLKKTKYKDVNALLEIGEAYINYNVKHPQEAIRLLTIASENKKGKSNADVWLTLGEAYGFLDRTTNPNATSESEKAYTQALYHTNRKSARALIRSAGNMIRVKNYNEAINRYKEALQNDPNYTPGYRKIAELYYAASRYKEASEYFEKYVQLADKSVETQYQYGAFLYLNAQELKKTKKEEAINEFNKALSIIKPLEGKIEKPEYYRVLAKTQLEVNQCEEASNTMNKFFSKATEKIIVPSDYEALGSIQYCLGQDYLGLQSWMKAAEMDTTEDRALKLYDRVIDSLNANKKYEEVGMLYDKVIAKYSGDSRTVKARNFYSQLRAYYSAQNFEKAIETAEKLIESEPELSIGYYWKANAQSASEAKKELPQGTAKASYEKYIQVANTEIEKAEEKDKQAKKDELNEGLAAAYYYLAVYYYNNKNIASMHENARKILELNPKRETYKTTANQLLEVKTFETPNQTPKTPKKSR